MVGRGLDECLIDQTVGIVGIVLRQVDALLHPRLQCSRLLQGLSVELAYPLRWTIGREDDEGLVLIVGLGSGRSHVDQCLA